MALPVLGGGVDYHHRSAAGGRVPRHREADLLLFCAFDSDNLTEGILGRLATGRSSHGVPDRLPAPRPRPTVLAVVEAWRAAGLHGRRWSGVDDRAVAERLPPCPDPATCRTEDGLDLGRWHLVGRQTPPMRADSPVEGGSFQGPRGPATLVALCALAALGGPYLVLGVAGDRADGGSGGTALVWPDDRPEALAEHWPWT